jgi:hypothetical protein
VVDEVGAADGDIGDPVTGTSILQYVDKMRERYREGAAAELVGFGPRGQVDLIDDFETEFQHILPERGTRGKLFRRRRGTVENHELGKDQRAKAGFRRAGQTGMCGR